MLEINSPSMLNRLTEAKRSSTPKFITSKIFQNPPRNPFHSLQTVCFKTGIELPASKGFDPSRCSWPSETPSSSESASNGFVPRESSNSSDKPSLSLSAKGGGRSGPPLDEELDELELEDEELEELDELELLLEELDELELEDEELEELELDELLELPPPEFTNIKSADSIRYPAVDV